MGRNYWLKGFINYLLNNCLKSMSSFQIPLFLWKAGDF